MKYGYIFFSNNGKQDYFYLLNILFLEICFVFLSIIRPSKYLLEAVHSLLSPPTK